MSRLWVERIALTSFRNYPSATITAGPEPVVLVGPNGAGKTNFLEAISLLSPGQGLRRANFADLQPRRHGDRLAVAARVLNMRQGAFEVGTGLTTSASTGRIVRIDGKPQTGSGALGDLVEMVWVTPAMDGLFTGPASDRRRFLDRLILCFDATHGTRANRFERAMQSRNRLLADGVRDNAQLEFLRAADGRDRRSHCRRPHRSVDRAADRHCGATHARPAIPLPLDLHCH